MTDKEKYDFIDNVVHLTLFVEDKLLDEHGGEYSGLEEDGIDSNEYYRIITERVINILKKNNNYMQEDPVSEDLEEASIKASFEDMKDRQIMEDSNERRNLYSRIFRRGFKAGAQWEKEKFTDKACEWLQKNDSYSKPTELQVMDFRKYMEE